jgi:hypothetical protein
MTSLMGSPAASLELNLNAIKPEGGGIALDPAGPFTLGAGDTVIINNVTGGGKSIRVEFFGTDKGVILTYDVPQGFAVNEIQGSGPGRFGKIKVTDMSNPGNHSFVSYIYGVAPGLGVPGLIALLVMLTGTGAWMLRSRRPRTAT